MREGSSPSRTTEKNKKYFTKCLADQNKVLIFVKQTTGVRKCDGGLTPTQKRKSSLTY